ncbi:hypothetical protein LF599_04870 [Pseudodesulfovibrio thermohalotolerans]|uniref:hypothetical protein n=1 Tax=Pseudodesulfovibrio thermohalotolerans TaxID=2880651 RepID=UPI002440FB62|nr:hypothetical protein [Pseudodesulfovibrio thermohalotolerans]WFS63502.1 hypothetical protein LF599_04870 [Pseudodesulfovibrio thermohalotolerans]
MRIYSRTHTFFMAFVLVMILPGAVLPALGDEARQTICSDLPGAAGLALDGRGNAYTTNCAANEVLCVPPDGDPVVYAKVEAPTALAVGRSRTVFVGTVSGAIFLIASDGSVSRAYDCGRPVSGLSIDRDGNLLVATGEGSILRLARENLNASK